MRTACEAETILPLWDQASVVDGGALAAGYTASDRNGSAVGIECSNGSRPSFWEEGPADERRAMLVLISEELWKVLKDVVRCASLLCMCLMFCLLHQLNGPIGARAKVVCIPGLPATWRQPILRSYCLLYYYCTVVVCHAVLYSSLLPLCTNRKNPGFLLPVAPSARRSRCTEPTPLHSSLYFTVCIICTEDWMVSTAPAFESTHNCCLYLCCPLFR